MENLLDIRILQDEKEFNKKRMEKKSKLKKFLGYDSWKKKSLR